MKDRLQAINQLLCAILNLKTKLVRLPVRFMKCACEIINNYEVLKFLN